MEIDYHGRVRLVIEAGGIATVTLTRPEKHNGFDLDMMDGLLRAAKRLRQAREVRAVILRGEGPSFCAGLDVKGVMGNRRRALLAFTQLWWPFRNRFQRVNLVWRELPVPVVAVVQGNCFGAGIQLAAGADLRFAHPDARLSIMESKWGLVPDMGATITLRHLLSRDALLDLTLTGRIVGAAEAWDLGLVSRVESDPEAAARAWIAEVMTRSPDAVAAAKKLFNEAENDSDGAALAAERRWQRRLMGSENQRRSAQRHLKGEAVPFLPNRFR
jgi:enoyl-CoA hydratase/carnithine racemase